MTKITYAKLSNESQEVIWRLLKDNIPKDIVPKFLDGMPVELRTRTGYPFVIVSPPRRVEARNRFDKSKKRVIIRFEINVHTKGDRASRQMREIIDKINSVFDSQTHQQTLRTYGFESLEIEDVIETTPENIDDIIYYNSRIMLYLEWGS